MKKILTLFAGLAALLLVLFSVPTFAADPPGHAYSIVMFDGLPATVPLVPLNDPAHNFMLTCAMWPCRCCSPGDIPLRQKRHRGPSVDLPRPFRLQEGPLPVMKVGNRSVA